MSYFQVKTYSKGLTFSLGYKILHSSMLFSKWSYPLRDTETMRQASALLVSDTEEPDELASPWVSLTVLSTEHSDLYIGII